MTKQNSANQTFKWFKTVKEPDCQKYYLLNILILSVKKKSRRITFKLFGILPIWKHYAYYSGFTANLISSLLFWLPGSERKKRFINGLLRKRCHIEFDDKNFTPFNINNDVLLEELTKIGKFTYLPNAGNLGDCLIAKSTYDFFDNHNLEYEIYNGKPVKTIVFAGGGVWFGNTYKKGCQRTLKIFQKAEKILILPSSVYECPSLVNALDERFVVFCREKQTYDYLCSQKTKAKIILDHDMALRASPKMLQGDTVITPELQAVIKNMLPAMKQLPKTARLIRTDAEKANDYPSDYDLSAAYGSKTMLKEEVDVAAKIMLSVVDLCQTVITDRLHVAIASALMGKEVYMLDNSYRKLSMVYENSLFECKNIHLCSAMPTDTQLGSDTTDNFYRLKEKI